jgi:hypothetical protein
MELFEHSSFNESAAERLKRLENDFRQNNKYNINRPSEMSVWDSIDMEIAPLSIDQRNKLMLDPEYVRLQEEVKSILNDEFIKFMKPYVENNPQGREILQRQLDYIKSIKGKVISETNKEMELMRKFQEASKVKPDITWDEFLKTIK